MLRTVVAGAIPSEIDTNIIPRITFLIADETVEHSYDVVARRRQGSPGLGSSEPRRHWIRSSDMPRSSTRKFFINSASETQPRRCRCSYASMPMRTAQIRDASTPHRVYDNWNEHEGRWLGVGVYGKGIQMEQAAEGRTREVDQVCARLLNHRLLVLMCRSKGEGEDAKGVA